MTTIHVTASRDYDVLVQPGLLDDAGAQIAQNSGRGRQTWPRPAVCLVVHMDFPPLAFPARGGTFSGRIPERRSLSRGMLGFPS